MDTGGMEKGKRKKKLQSPKKKELFMFPMD